MLSGIYADVAIIGTNGISSQRGLTTPDPAEASVKQAMLASARRKVVLADHSKFGDDHFAQFGTLADIDVVITDSGTDSNFVSDIRSHNIDVVIA